MRHKFSLCAVVLFASCSAPEPAKPTNDNSDRLVVLTSANFETQVLRNKQPVLIDVGAPG